jgi:hypothetical protein
MIDLWEAVAIGIDWFIVSIWPLIRLGMTIGVALIMLGVMVWIPCHPKRDGSKW